jgi:hypothetical protein
MPRFLGFWRTHFAYLPVRMDDGRLIWWQPYEERQVILGSDTVGDLEVLVTMRRLPPERMIP